MNVTQCRGSVYCFVGLLLVLLMGMTACTIEPTPETVAGSEVVAEEEAVEGENVVVEPATDGEEVGIGVANSSDNMIRASRLLDYDFVNLDDEVSGEIEDVLVDTSNGRILFVLIEYGGFLDLGDTRLAMPLNAFSWGADNELILNFEEERLETFPELGDEWPNLEESLWDDAVNEYWTSAGINPGFDIDSDVNTVMYMSDLLDMNVGDVGFGEGEIHDVLVNLSQSQASYLIADYGEGLFNNNLVAIPFSAFFGRIIDDQFYFDEDINLEVLEGAPALDRTGFEDAQIFERGFDAEVRDYWRGMGYEVEPNVNS